MSASEHPMLPHLVDLESNYESDADRSYDPRDLMRYALGASDYWADLALGWLDQGAPDDDLDAALLDVEENRERPQPLRHHARRLRKAP